MPNVLRSELWLSGLQGIRFIMESRLKPCFPLPFEVDNFDELVNKAKDWAIMHVKPHYDKPHESGAYNNFDQLKIDFKTNQNRSVVYCAAMRSKTAFSMDSLNIAPFTLLPSTFPKKEFERAVTLQTVINELVHKVAHDHEFLEESLKNTIKVDKFTGRLYSLYDTVRKEGYGQCMSLGLIRSDLMLEGNCICRCSLHNPRTYYGLRQVEFNTIAAGFGWLGIVSSLIHRYVLQELGHIDKLKNLPENKALTGLCEGMIEAWKIYGSKKAVILFVVEDVTYNICDQRFHEFEIRRINPDVRVIRQTLTEIGNFAKLGPNKELLIGGDEVAVVYMRAGYEPGHYRSEHEWGARLLVERAVAIKCPSIHYHLAGTKKVQQALAKSGCLERFLTDPKKVEAVRQIFTGLYSLDLDETGEAGVALALSAPDRYVLKPQREGGGNNIYGQDIRPAIEAMQHSEERAAWILMDRILPPVQANYIIRAGQPIDARKTQDIVCELGIFGVVIGDGKTILANRQVGHMLRSKLSSSDEGGVAAGAGALDSPYLI